MKTLNLLDECSTLRAHLPLMGFTGGSDDKESACNVRDLGSISGSGRFPGEGRGYPFQYSGLQNSVNCIVHGITRSWTQQSDFHFTHTIEPFGVLLKTTMLEFFSLD